MAPDCKLWTGRWFDGFRLVERPVTVTVRQGKIASITDTEIPPPGATVVPESSLLCPGFIDSHSHSDFTLVADPRALGAVMQGITTQVIGQCGFSAAPLGPDAAGERAVADDPTALAGMASPSWTSFEQYRDHLQSRGPAINVLPFVGHNTLMRCRDSADPKHVTDLAEMAIDGGARGISTGLSYQLGRRSSDEGVARLVALAGRRAVPYHTHMRYSSEETVETLAHTLDLLSGRHPRPTVSHVFPRLRDQESTAEQLLQVIEKYASRFDSLTFDITVYEQGGTAWTQGLPDWAIGADYAALSELAADPKWRRDVVRFLQKADGWVSDWDNLLVTKVNTSESRPMLGRTIGELASVAGSAPEEFAVDLLARDGHFWVSPPNKRWDDIVELLSSDRCIPMGDGMTVDPRDPSRLVALDRSWNAFRRFLSTVVPSAGMELGTALRKLTSDAAQRLSLDDRGVIAEGAAADLVVLAPSEIGELEPPDFQLRGRGIEAVMVNGLWVLHQRSGFTQARPGLVL